MEFYYDVVCPYAYMAFTFLNSRKAFCRNNIELKPILLGGLFKHMSVDVNPNRSMVKIKADYQRYDLARQADYFSVPLRLHPRHPLSTVLAMRLIHACDPAKRLSLTESLYRAYFEDNRDIDDDLVLNELADRFEIAKTSLEEAKESLRKATEEAFLKKVFGVPTIFADDRLYFGGDRLILIEDPLKIKVPDAPWIAGEPIDFYFDFSSPYSYLAWAEVVKAQSLGVTFNIKPILLGALFKEIGTVNIPMLSAHPNKTAYFMRDMKDWARYRNIRFRFNSNFPLRTVTPLRVALVLEETIGPIFSAAWALNENIGDPFILAQVLHRAGFDQQRLLEHADNEAVKDQLKANTKEAVERGVFGVPTFFVGNNKVFGQDRFPWIKQEIQRHHRD